MLFKRLDIIKKYGIESFLLLVIFSLSWLGFGSYTAGLLALLSILTLFFKPKREFLFSLFRDKPFIILLILFVLNNVISSLFSIDKLISTSISLVWFLMVYIPISYVRFSLNRGNDFFIKWIVPAGFLVSLVIIIYLYTLFLQNLSTQGPVWKIYTFRFLGTGSTPDMIIMLGGIGYGWIRHKEGEKYRWLGFLFFLFCFSGVVLTLDRGGLISFFILMLIVLSYDYKRLCILFIIIGIMIYLSFKIDFLGGLRYLYKYLYDPATWDGLMRRTQIASFRTAWGMIKDHWLLGVGTNNFWKFSDQYGTRKFTYAHNIVLQFWAENGLFGMIFGLSIIGLIIYRWLKSFKLYKYSSIALCMGASFIAMLVGQLTNCTIWVFSTAIPFWLLAGSINAIYYIVKDTKGDSPIKSNSQHLN